MSSGYKIKGHQRSRSAKPYDRKTGTTSKQGLVNRVKEWLTPSSWLGSWSKGTNDVAAPPPPPLQETSLTPPSTSLFVPKPGALANPFLSNPLALLGGSQSEAGPRRTSGVIIPPRPVNLASAGITNPQSTLDITHSNSSMETRLRSLVSLPQSLRSRRGVPSQPISMDTSQEEDVDDSKESETSWIAEDDGSTHIEVEQQQQQHHEQPRVSETRGQRSQQPHPPKSSLPPLNLSDVEKSDLYTYELGEGSAGIVQPVSSVTPVATEAEQVIMQVENPAAKTPSVAKSLPSTKVTPSMGNSRTLLSSSILSRLYTTNPPFAMSTPQLSPVHETREEADAIQVDTNVAKLPTSDSGASSSRFHSQASILTASIGDSSLPLPAVTTPSKFHTEESLRRSPFRSPFYSGRTSFGGAASGQKPRLKRPRTESSPPVFAPLRVSVKARPVSSSGSKGRQMVASQTARKIMETLGSLSSPLASARKLPMRALPGDTQLAKRRRVSVDAQTSSGASRLLSPPPVTPLRTLSQPPTLITGTRTVSSEKMVEMARQYPASSVTCKTIRDSGGVDSNAPPTKAPPSSRMPSSELPSRSSEMSLPPNASSLSLSSSAFPPSAGSKTGFTVPNFSSTQSPQASSILSGLKFTAPPLSMKPVERTDEDGRQRSPTGSNTSMPQQFLSHAVKNASRGGGKMRTARKRRHGAAGGDEDQLDEEDEGYVNPMAQPPAVGLTLGKGATLPKFMFHTQLQTSSKSQDAVAPTAVGQSLSTLLTAAPPTMLTSSPNFSFSAPKSVSSESGPSQSTSKQTLKQGATFDFSSPKDQRLTPTPPPPPSSSSSLPSFTSQSTKPSPFLTATLKPSPQPATFAPLPKMTSLTSPSPAVSLGKLKEQPKGVQPAPPPLKAMSVEEALKKPEFQLPLSRTMGAAPVTKVDAQKASVCIDLTDSDDEKESGTKRSSSAGPAVGTKVSLGSGGLQLGRGGGLQLGSNAGTNTASGTMPLPNSVLAVKLGAASGTPSTTTNLSLSKTDSSKPSASPLKSLSQFAPPSGSWECSQCLVSNKATDEKCVACSALKPSASKTKIDSSSKSGNGAPIFKPLSQFAPQTGSWECNQCLVNNKAGDAKCVACAAPKPTKSSSQPSSLSLSASGSTSVLKSSETVKKVALGIGQPSLRGWPCEVCLVQNKASDVKCVACTASKPGPKPLSSAAPPATIGGKWTCDTCLVVNKAEDTKCVACSNPRKTTARPSVPSNILSGFAPPKGSWACDTCLVQNKEEDDKCVSCTTPRPAAKPSNSDASKPATSSAAPTAGELTVGAAGGLKLGGGLSLAGFPSNSSGQEGIKPLGGVVGPATKDTGAAGGIKINSLLPSLSQNKKEDESKAGSSGSSGSGLVFGLPPQAGASSSSVNLPTIAQLPEKNPLAGIKFSVTAPVSTATTAAASQNPLAGIKFGVPSSSTPSTSTTSASSLQFNLGSTSSSTVSSPFKLSSIAGTGNEGTGGLMLGGSATPSTVNSSGKKPPAVKLGPGLGTSAMSLQSSSLGSGIFGSGTQPMAGAGTANSLAGLKFGVSAQPPSGGSALSSNTPPNQLQFPGQLQFGTSVLSSSTASATSSSSSVGPSFNFSTTSSSTGTTSSQGTTALSSPFVFSGATKSVTNKPSVPVLFGSSALGSATTSSLQQQQQPMMNSMLNTSSTGEKASSSLFALSGSKDVSKIDSSSPFPTAGSASGSSSLGGFGAGGMGGASGLGVGGASPFNVKFGATQPSTNQPFQFGKNSVGGGTSGSLFGKQEPAIPSQGLSQIGQQAASGLGLPQQQGSSLFGMSGQQQQSQPQVAFGSSQPPSFNFSSGQSSTTPGGLGGSTATNLNFPSNTGGLNLAGASTQNMGGLDGMAQTAAGTSSESKGFKFDPNAGVNFNFGGGSSAMPMGGDTMLFSAGSSQNTSATTSRVIKKARRRMNK